MRRTYGVADVDQRTYTFDCNVSEVETVAFYDGWLTARGFVRDDPTSRWSLDHTNDIGNRPGMAVWLRDTPEADSVSRLVFVLAYARPSRFITSGWYVGLLGRGTVAGEQAGKRLPYTAPGAPGHDRSYGPPRTYPDSLQLAVMDPIDRFGRDEYGLPRGWRRKPRTLPECRD